MRTNEAADVLRRWEELDFELLLGIKAAALEMDGAEGRAGAVVLALEYPPGYHLPSHWHACGHVEVILAGSLRVGERWEHAGDVRVVPARYSYGPLESGPEGCKALEFFPDRVALFGEMDDPAEMLELLGDTDAGELQERLQRLLGVEGPVFGGLPG